MEYRLGVGRVEAAGLLGIADSGGQRGPAIGPRPALQYGQRLSPLSRIRGCMLVRLAWSVVPDCSSAKILV